MDSKYNVSQDTRIQESDVWAVIDNYFETNGIVSQQIESYNKFITELIPEAVAEAKCIEYV
jgi:DNA-directed RNA polymerase beta subunit